MDRTDHGRAQVQPVPPAPQAPTPSPEPLDTGLYRRVEQHAQILADFLDGLDGGAR